MQDKIQKIRSLKLLFVEDEKALLTIIEDTLKKLQCNFVTANNGLEALKILESTKDIDVVITDLNMPLMNGIELIKYINEKELNIPVIVMSAYIETTYLGEVEQLGVKNYLYKPFDFKKFIDLIINLEEKE